jgi:hypothetical protein
MQMTTSNTKHHTTLRIAPSLSPCGLPGNSISGCRVFRGNSNGPTSCFTFASSMSRAYLANMNVRRAGTLKCCHAL